MSHRRGCLGLSTVKGEARGLVCSLKLEGAQPWWGWRERRRRGLEGAEQRLALGGGSRRPGCIELGVTEGRGGASPGAMRDGARAGSFGTNRWRGRLGAP